MEHQTVSNWRQHNEIQLICSTYLHPQLSLLETLPSVKAKHAQDQTGRLSRQVRMISHRCLLMGVLRTFGEREPTGGVDKKKSSARE